MLRKTFGHLFASFGYLAFPLLLEMGVALLGYLILQVDSIRTGGHIYLREMKTANSKISSAYVLQMQAFQGRFSV